MRNKFFNLSPVAQCYFMPTLLYLLCNTFSLRLLSNSEVQRLAKKLTSVRCYQLPTETNFKHLNVVEGSKITRAKHSAT